MDATIETHGLTRRFGSTLAIDDLSFRVRPGRVTGFVGPNGAGKTTTLHLILGLAQSNRIAVGRVDEVLRLVGLSSAAGRPTRGFSLGMRQRLGLAAALLGDPPVLILDEPGNGLDPEGIQWLRALLRSLADEGRTVFVSSHLMSELEGTADHVIAIGHGRLLADASVDDLIASAAESHTELRTPDATR